MSLRPDLAGLVLAAALAGLLAQAIRLFRRWRIGQAAPVDWIAGLRRLPRGYFHTVHDVVARDPYASRMHALAAGGLVTATALSFPLHLLGVPRGLAVGMAGAILLAVALSFFGVLLVARRRLPRPPRRLSGGRFNLLPAALAGALVFLCGSALRVIVGTGAPGAAPRAWDWLIALDGAVALAVLVAWSADGPMRHAVAGLVNLVAHGRPRRVEGGHDAALKPLDLSTFQAGFAAAPVAGAATAQSFEWRSLAQFDACVQCGRCQEACPAHAAGQPLNPKRLIQTLVAATTAAQGSAPPAALVEDGGGVGLIAPETLWACTTCRACVYECPMLIEHVDAIVDVRRHQTLERGLLPDKAGETIETLRGTDTLAGRPLGERLDWAADLTLPRLAERDAVDVLVWLGEAAFDRRNQRTLRALVGLLRRAGVDFAVLGEEELDCGDLARRLGDEVTFQDLARRNIATLARYRFDRIVTADPHAYHVLKNEYPALGGHYQVEHHSVTLDRLFDEGRLRAGPTPATTMTYHDPCYLARYNGEVDAPRRLLGQLGFSVTEMERSGLRARCCGGGGGASLADIPGERRIPDMRIDQAKAVGATTVATGCPNCASMLEGVTGPRPVVRDLAELALAAVEAREASLTASHS